MSHHFFEVITIENEDDQPEFSNKSSGSLPTLISKTASHSSHKMASIISDEYSDLFGVLNRENKEKSFKKADLSSNKMFLEAKDKAVVYKDHKIKELYGKNGIGIDCHLEKGLFLKDNEKTEKLTHLERNQFNLNEKEDNLFLNHELNGLIRKEYINDREIQNSVFLGSRNFKVNLNQNDDFRRKNADNQSYSDQRNHLLNENFEKDEFNALKLKENENYNENYQIRYKTNYPDFDFKNRDKNNDSYKGKSQKMKEKHNFYSKKEKKNRRKKHKNPRYYKERSNHISDTSSKKIEKSYNHHNSYYRKEKNAEKTKNGIIEKDKYHKHHYDHHNKHEKAFEEMKSKEISHLNHKINKDSCLKYYHQKYKQFLQKAKEQKLKEESISLEKDTSETKNQGYQNEIGSKSTTDIIEESGDLSFTIGNFKDDKVSNVKSLIIQSEKEGEPNNLLGKIVWKVRKNKDHMGATIMPLKEIEKAVPEETARFLLSLFDKEIKDNLF